jgi:two-component system, OmpR family, alkaline phosphatase synthesis response regulator PhoP
MERRSQTEGQDMARRILIADDEPNIVISLEYLMKREGFEVSIAEDGDQAVAMIRAHPPDLVILDVMMPKRNGFEVCQEIKSDPKLQSVRILMLTAKGRETEVTKGLALGADAYVTKPFSTKELVERVRAMLANA